MSTIRKTRDGEGGGSKNSAKKSKHVAAATAATESDSGSDSDSSSSDSDSSDSGSDDARPGAPSLSTPLSDEQKTYLRVNAITIHEEGAPPPCLELRDAPFPPPLVSLLCAQGFAAPSAVQASTWPIAVAGRDVLAIAKTGSGKTLGFLLPVLSRCFREKAAGKPGSPIALIMAPTRELALQIHVRGERN